MKLLHIVPIACLVAFSLPATVRADEPQPNGETNSGPFGLTIDVGRFLPAGNTVLVQLGNDDQGNKGVQVQVESPASEEKTGVNVDVGTDKSGEKKVNVDVQTNGKKKVQLDIRSFIKPGEADSEAAPEPENVKKETYLGVFTRSLPDELAAQLAPQLPKGGGLLIGDVIADSPAAKAGLKKFDVLTSFDGKPLTSVEQFKELIVEQKPGHTAKLGIIRAAAPTEIQAVLGERTVPTARLIRLNIQLDNGENFLYRYFPSAVVIDNGTVQLRAQKLALNILKRAQAGSTGASQTVRVISRDNGKTFHVDLEYSDEKGEQHKHAIEGTAAEIREKMKDIPKNLQDTVFGMLDRPDWKESKDRTLQFRLQPGVENNGFRLNLSQPAPNGELRMLQIDRPTGGNADGNKFSNAGDLMNLEIVAEELKQLPPTVQTQITNTLKKLPAPQAQVNVEQSQ